MRRRTFLAGAAAILAPSAKAEILKGAQALAGDRFQVGEEEYHLADIKAPSPYALQNEAQPYFEEARRSLARLLVGSSLTVSDAAPPTRWGARVVRADRAGDAQSLQNQLVRIGAARVAPQTDDLVFIDELLVLESEARAARNGLWSSPAYQIFNAERAEGAVGGYHLIEGEVARAAKAKGRFYLNFGKDIETDFTASARAGLSRRWATKGLDLASLDGARLRIRGFVEDINGPSIDLKHMRQIEILGGAE